MKGGREKNRHRAPLFNRRFLLPVCWSVTKAFKQDGCHTWMLIYFSCIIAVNTSHDCCAIVGYRRETNWIRAQGRERWATHAIEFAHYCHPCSWPGCMEFIWQSSCMIALKAWPSSVVFLAFNWVICMRCEYCSFTRVENILANDVCSCFAHLSRGGLRFHRHGSVVESLCLLRQRRATFVGCKLCTNKFSSAKENWKDPNLWELAQLWLTFDYRLAGWYELLYSSCEPRSRILSRLRRVCHSHLRTSFYFSWTCCLLSTKRTDPNISLRRRITQHNTTSTTISATIPVVALRWHTVISYEPNSIHYQSRASNSLVISTNSSSSSSRRRSQATGLRCSQKRKFADSLSIYKDDDGQSVVAHPHRSCWTLCLSFCQSNRLPIQLAFAARGSAFVWITWWCLVPYTQRRSPDARGLVCALCF